MVKTFSPRRLGAAFKYAGRGIWHVLHSELNMRVHVLVVAIVIIVAAYYRVSALEFAVLLLTAGLVLTLEIINAVVEDFLDVIHPSQHEAIRRIKDALAGAVLLAAIVAVAVAGLVFVPHFLAGR